MGSAALWYNMALIGIPLLLAVGGAVCFYHYERFQNWAFDYPKLIKISRVIGNTEIEFQQGKLKIDDLENRSVILSNSNNSTTTSLKTGFSYRNFRQSRIIKFKNTIYKSFFYITFQAIIIAVTLLFRSDFKSEITGVSQLMINYIPILFSLTIPFFIYQEFKGEYEETTKVINDELHS